MSKKKSLTTDNTYLTSLSSSNKDDEEEDKEAEEPGEGKSRGEILKEAEEGAAGSKKRVCGEKSEGHWTGRNNNKSEEEGHPQAEEQNKDDKQGEEGEKGTLRSGEEGGTKNDGAGSAPKKRRSNKEDMESKMDAASLGTDGRSADDKELNDTKNCKAVLKGDEREHVHSDLPPAEEVKRLLKK